MSSHKQLLEESRQSMVLFSIVILFFSGHVLRNFLNFHEALNFDKKKQDYFHGCHGMPLWILVIGLMSHLLLTCNSALNFVLYSVVSEGFRLGKLFSIYFKQ